MTVTNPVRLAEIAILRYLIAHQDARDTLEGIEKWWLPQFRPYALGDIAAALRLLEERKLVLVWKSASSKPVYGCGAASADSLAEYLRTLE